MKHALIGFALWAAACGARTDLDAAGGGGSSAVTTTGPTTDGGGGGEPGPPVCNAGDPPETLASGLSFPYGITTDDTYVYFATYDDDHGGVWRVNKRGGTLEPLATGLDYPDQLVLVGDSLYVTESGANRIIRIPKGGGTVEPFATGQSGPSGITYDGSTLFWVNYFGDRVVASDLAGNTKVLGMPTDPFRIAAGTDRVFFSAAGPDLRWILKDGSDSGSIPSPTPRMPAFGRDGRVYWTDGGVFFANPDGSDLQSFGIPESGLFYDGLALDDDHVFAAVAEGDIVRFSLHHEPPVVLVTGVENFPAIVALDASCVFWTNTGLGDGTGSVMRAPKEP